MKSDPIDVARRNIVETKQLLETLILSSESFDYVKAKLALKQLQKKVRDLAKLEARWSTPATAENGRPPNVCVVDFEHPRTEAQGK
jgi:hypothetical protein